MDGSFVGGLRCASWIVDCDVIWNCHWQICTIAVDLVEMAGLY